MTAQFLKVQLLDEAPAVGSGNRTVFVAIGRKWVSIRNPYTLRSARISMLDWRSTARSARTAQVRHTRLARAVRTYERATGQKRSKAVKAMLIAAKNGQTS